MRGGIAEARAARIARRCASLSWSGVSAKYAAGICDTNQGSTASSVCSREWMISARSDARSELMAPRVITGRRGVGNERRAAPRQPPQGTVADSLRPVEVVTETSCPPESSTRVCAPEARLITRLPPLIGQPPAQRL